MNRLEFIFNKFERKKTKPQALINHNLAVYIDGKREELVQDLQILASISNGSQLVRAYVKKIVSDPDGRAQVTSMGEILVEEYNKGLMTDSLVVQKIEKDDDGVLNFHLQRKAI